MASKIDTIVSEELPTLRQKMTEVVASIPEELQVGLMLGLAHEASTPKAVKDGLLTGLALLGLMTARAATAPARPKIVCLCGSTRFATAFAVANERETLAGNIVLSVGCFRRTAPDGDREPLEEAIKVKLDQLHFRKIDLCDEIFVCNVEGYIGQSTRNEINYATEQKKPVRYLEAL